MSISSIILKCGLAAATLALAALPASAQQVTKIRAVAQPIANFAPLLVAREKGIFKELNLEVTWNIVAQGALGVEAVATYLALRAGAIFHCDGVQARLAPR